MLPPYNYRHPAALLENNLSLSQHVDAASGHNGPNQFIKQNSGIVPVETEQRGDPAKAKTPRGKREVF
jgi:hypothetical protein